MIGYEQPQFGHAFSAIRVAQAGCPGAGRALKVVPQSWQVMAPAGEKYSEESAATHSGWKLAGSENGPKYAAMSLATLLPQRSHVTPNGSLAPQWGQAVAE